MTITMETSVTNTTMQNVGASATVGANAQFFSSSVTASFNYETTKEEMKSRSTENTYETALTKVEGTTESLSYTIGEHNQPAGKYRTTLFGATDVYYVLKTDKKFAFVDAFTFACTRPADTLYWGIDYDPDTGGNFGKTAETENLNIPDLSPEDLEAPSDPLPPAPPPPPDQPLKTEWTGTKTDQFSTGRIGTKTEYFLSDFDVNRLRNEGYTQFTVAIKFLVKQGQTVFLSSVSTVKVSANGNEVLNTLGTVNNTTWEERTADGGIIPIGSFNNLLLVEWGSQSVAYSSRTVTIRAVKP
jgi:hypothetical protein